MSNFKDGRHWSIKVEGVKVGVEPRFYFESKKLFKEEIIVSFAGGEIKSEYRFHLIAEIIIIKSYTPQFLCKIISVFRDCKSSQNRRYQVH